MPELSAHKGLKIFAIAALFAATASLLAAMAVLGNYDTNEGWYANDVYLLMRGERPYVDFFYHRLPLFLYSFVPFLQVAPLDWVTLRLIGAGWFLLSLVFLALLLRKKKDFSLFVFAITFALVNLHGLHIYATVQSYGLVACLLTAAVLLAGRESFFRIAALATVLTVAQWIRYPIDYLPIALVLFLVLVHGRRPLLVLTGVGTAAALHGLLALLFWSEPFRNDLILGMFPSAALDGAGSPFSLAYKSEWAVYGLRWFFPLLLAVPLIFYRKKIPAGGSFDLGWTRRHPRLTLSLLLILGNFGMNFSAPEGHIVQMYFVFPLMIFVFSVLFFRLKKEASAETRRLFSLSLVTALAVSPFLTLQDRDFRLSLAQADTAAVRELGNEIAKLCAPDQEFFTLTPILGLAAGRRVARGLEFETYGYFEGLSDAEARAKRLLNREILLSLLDDPRLCALHVDERLTRPGGNASRLRSVRDEVLKKIDLNFALRKRYSQPPVTNLRGEASVFK